jgi:hypothetical protein
VETAATDVSYFVSWFRLFLAFENNVLLLVSKVRENSKAVLEENRLYECNVEIIAISQIHKTFVCV